MHTDFMEHFAVIQSLCRTALATGDLRVRKQVERLLVRLEKNGEEREAETLKRLLESEQRATMLAPSRIELSKSSLSGETLTASVHAPHDRESSAPLADIILNPGDYFPAPIFDADLQSAIDALLEEWSSFAALSRLGVSPSRTSLIFGLPGTGKTITAFNIAARLGLPLVVAKLDGMMSSFLGTTARNIGNLFEFANRYRCVLLLDEFDAIAKLRDDPQEVGEIKRVVNTLLQSLDTRAAQGITIAITNHPGLLDPAIWRRFEVKIEMPLPSAAQRAAMFEEFLAPLSATGDTNQLLTWVTEGATGAEIRGMVNAIKRHSVLNSAEKGTDSVSPRTMLDALQRYAITNAGLSDRPRLTALRGDEKALARALISDDARRFTQSSVASLLNRDQATISRWLKEEAA